MRKQKQPFLDGIAPLVRERYGDRADDILAAAWGRYGALCAENASEAPAMRMHTRRHIYPAISIFGAAAQATGDREAARMLIYDYYTARSRKPASVLRGILKIPGLYRRVPGIFASMTHKKFGPAAGFRFQFYHTPKNETRFDMLECPYLSICQKYGCAEIVPAFCAADDVAYGHMHPKLIWGRTKTLGNGADCCDFHLTAEGRKPV